MAIITHRDEIDNSMILKTQTQLAFFYQKLRKEYVTVL